MFVLCLMGKCFQTSLFHLFVYFLFQMRTFARAARSAGFAVKTSRSKRTTNISCRHLKKYCNTTKQNKMCQMLFNSLHRYVFENFKDLMIDAKRWNDIRDLRIDVDKVLDGN
jgi:hypothetical protein